jgi:hypothetical protein
MAKLSIFHKVFRLFERFPVLDCSVVKPYHAHCGYKVVAKAFSTVSSTSCQGVTVIYNAQLVRACRFWNVSLNKLQPRGQRSLMMWEQVTLQTLSHLHAHLQQKMPAQLTALVSTTLSQLAHVGVQEAIWDKLFAAEAITLLAMMSQMASPGLEVQK